jgi:hypothetical protein
LEHVTVKEAAEALQISERLMRRACSLGRVPGALQSGKSWIMPRESLTAWTRRPVGRPRIERAAKPPRVETNEQQIARLEAGTYSDADILSDRQLRRREETERELVRLIARGEPHLMTAALRKPKSGDEPRDTLSPAQIAQLPKEVREARAAELAEQLNVWGVYVEAPIARRARLVTDKPASRLYDEPDPYGGPDLGRLASLAPDDPHLAQWLQTDGYSAHAPKRIGGLTIRKVTGLKDLPR